MVRLPDPRPVAPAGPTPTEAVRPQQRPSVGAGSCPFKRATHAARVFQFSVIGAVEGRGFKGMGGVSAEGGGDVGDAFPVQQVERHVAQGGEDCRGGAGASRALPRRFECCYIRGDRPGFLERQDRIPLTATPHRGRVAWSRITALDSPLRAKLMCRGTTRPVKQDNVVSREGYGDFAAAGRALGS
jgi:hypothetical protein